MQRLLNVLVTLAASLAAGRALAVDLFWNDDTGIRHVDRDGMTRPRLLYETFQTRGLAIDELHGALLWSDVLPLGAPGPAGVIRQGSILGGEFTTVANQLPNPASVAVDDRRGRVFWTDLGDANNPSAIFSANTDGTDAKKIVSAIWIADIAGIALDDARGQLYFSYNNPLIDAVNTGGIARASLDGSIIEPVVGGLRKPIGVAVDPLGGGLYWADPGEIGATDGNGRIEAATLDGQNQRLILGGLEIPYGVALDLENRDVYWTDMGTGKIQRTAMSGSLPFFEDVLVELKNPTALAIPRTSIGPGDANGDGRIDRADAAVLARNYGRSDDTVNWMSGDFNGDHLVSFADLAILTSHFTPGDSDTGPVSVPEPGAAILLPAAAGLLSFRRLIIRRRNVVRTT